MIENGSRREFATAPLAAVSRLSNASGTLVVLALVAVVNFDVIARGVFSAPFQGAIEVVQFSMVLIVFLQLPDVIRVNRLTRSDGFLTILGAKYPAIGAVLSRVINLVTAAFMAAVAYAVWPEFLEAWETGDYFGTPGIFTAPWWPVKLVIVFSAALSALICINKALTGDKAAPEAASADREHEPG